MKQKISVFKSLKIRIRLIFVEDLPKSNFEFSIINQLFATYKNCSSGQEFLMNFQFQVFSV